MRKLAPDSGHVAVVFELPAAVGARRAAIAGDFTAWNKVEMNPLADGSFTLTVDLPVGGAYRFRYFVDDLVWENDWAADDYVPNPFGGEDSVVIV